MLGAHPVALAVWGIAAALAAACCRVVLLLITRASLQGADARLITWYSLDLLDRAVRAGRAR